MSPHTSGLPRCLLSCSFGFGYTHGGAQHSEGETEDEFAQRIWQEMQRRKQAASGPSAATQETWGAADEAAKQRDVRALIAKCCQDVTVQMSIRI